jgi:XisI protein
MDNSRQYAEILTQMFRAMAIQHCNPRSLKIRSICDGEAGQFLLVATGWERSEGKLAWHDYIMVDAWLQDGKVVVVESNMEDLLEELIDAGIAEADIVSIEELEDLERSVT